MKPKFEHLNLIKNEENHRFELSVDGFISFIDYKERPGVITLIHTESPPELAGRGVATALVQKTLAYLEQNKYELVPLCPYVFAYIKRHPEWIKIVREDFKNKF